MTAHLAQVHPACGLPPFGAIEIDPPDRFQSLRRQDSNLDLTAPKAVVLPLHHGGLCRPRDGDLSSLPEVRGPHVSPAHPGATRVFRIRPRFCGTRGGDACVTPSAPRGVDKFSVEFVIHDNGGMPGSDEVDRIVDAWLRERPDLDFAPLQVLSRVARLTKHLDRARRTAFSRSELESWEFDVLSALRRAGAPYELSPKSLLQQTLVSSGTMTNRIDRLVDRDLVTRRTDPNDGRGILVGMNPAGLTRVDAAITRLIDAEEKLLSTLSESDQEHLAGLLRKLSLDFD